LIDGCRDFMRKGSGRKERPEGMRGGNVVVREDGDLGEEARRREGGGWAWGERWRRVVEPGADGVPGRR
jgi:hypothetical protein